MQHLDLQVVEQALHWLQDEQPIWLCTVLSTFGSSPREPGSLLVARGDGRHIGSLSGGCVEEDFLMRVVQGEFSQRAAVMRYGAGSCTNHVTLPCGGTLDVLIEKLLPATDTAHLEALLAALAGQGSRIRQVDINSGEKIFIDDAGIGPRVNCDERNGLVHIRIAPTARLIIAGISTVAQACAEFATTLGFEVIVCDPRDEAWGDFSVKGINAQRVMPASFIAQPGNCHKATAIVALTHDPRIDDLALMEAVRTPAFYIGAMGSHQTSAARAERLQRVGGLSEEDIARLHMPIGLALGSKTPAEIALAVMADILRVQRGKARDEL